MAQVTNQLVTEFTFEGSTLPLQQYNQDFESAISLTTKAVGIVTTLTGAFYAFAAAQFQVIDKMGQLSRETGTSIEFLQEWGYVASVNGGTIDSLQNSIRGLSEKIGEASLQGSEDFNRLGISVRDFNGNVKSTEQVLEEVRQSFQGLSKEQQISFAQKLGIDRGLLQTLNLTNSELEETRKRIRAIGIVSEEDANRVIKFNDSVTTTKFALQAIGQQISLSMLPNMSMLIDSFNDLILTNADLIRNGLSVTIDVLSSFVMAFVNTGKVIVNGIDQFIGLENAMLAAGGAVLFFNRALIASPVAKIVGGVLLLVAAVDDLYVAFQGGQSVIKDFFASFNIDIVNTLKSVFDGVQISLNGFLALLLQISEALTSVVLIGAQAGNLIGFDIDTSGIEEFKRLQEQTRLGLTTENQRLANDILNRQVTTNQNVTVNQNIQGQDAERIADLTNANLSEAIESANAQVNKGGR